MNLFIFSLDGELAPNLKSKTSNKQLQKRHVSGREMKKSEVSIHCLLLVSDFRIGPDSPSGEHINEIHDNHKANFSTINIDFHRSNKTENSFSLFKRLPLCPKDFAQF